MDGIVKENVAVNAKDAATTGALVHLREKIFKLGIIQGLLYHRTCKPDFLFSWPSLNSYLK